jgi:hypothetical protein
MTRRVPIFFWTATVISLAATLACEFERRQYPVKFQGLMPLQVALPPDGQQLRASFTAVWSAAHAVALSFPRELSDPELERLIAQAGSGFGSARPLFDFEWRVLEGTVEIGRGTRPRLATGASYGTRNSLDFGEFPAEAGRTYVVELTTGPDFDRFMVAQPWLEVGVNEAGPSIGLALEREFVVPVEVFFGVVSLVLLSWAIVVTRRSRPGG